MGSPRRMCTIGQLRRAGGFDALTGSRASSRRSRSRSPSPSTSRRRCCRALPVYLATGNIVLAYNLLFLSTFVLSGLGMFLLVRELTGTPGRRSSPAWRSRSAPYRLTQLPHLQMLSRSGCRSRCMASAGTSTPGAGCRWPAPPRRSSLQNLSCGYYLLFFAPVLAGLYAVWELATGAGWRSGGWAIARRRPASPRCLHAAVPAPYLEAPAALRRARSFEELMSYSADRTPT